MSQGDTTCGGARAGGLPALAHVPSSTGIRERHVHSRRVLRESLEGGGGLLGLGVRLVRHVQKSLLDIQSFDQAVRSCTTER